MKRRNFLKGLFAAPAAVPAVMAEAQSMVMGSVTHPTDRLIGATPSNYWISGTKTPDSKYWQSELTGAKNYLAELLSPERRQIAISNTLRHLSRLDPDIAAMRSLSMSARMRMQAERNVDRETASDVASIEGRIKHFTEQLSKLF